MYSVGIDIGSTSGEAVILNGNGILAASIVDTGYNSRRAAELALDKALADSGLKREQIGPIVATGYGRIAIEFADRQVTEISCYAKGMAHIFPDVRTVVDIGGQDSKGIKLKDGRAVDFVMNDKCAAGTGRFLEVAAEELGVRLEDMGKLSLEAKKVVRISNTCTVFAAQEVVTKLSEGAALADIIAGLHEAIATRIYGMLRRLKVEREVALTGGGAKNIGLVRALEAKLGFAVLVPPEPLLTGAIGAALLGKDIVKEAEAKGTPLTKAERRLTEATLFT